MLIAHVALHGFAIDDKLVVALEGPRRSAATHRIADPARDECQSRCLTSSRSWARSAGTTRCGGSRVQEGQPAHLRSGSKRQPVRQLHHSALKVRVGRGFFGPGHLGRLALNLRVAIFEDCWSWAARRASIESPFSGLGSPCL